MREHFGTYAGIGGLAAILAANDKAENHSGRCQRIDNEHSGTGTGDRSRCEVVGLYVPETHYEVFELPYPQENGLPRLCDAPARAPQPSCTVGA